MAAYRADIEIGVRGLRQVELLQRKIKEVSDTVTELAFKRFNIDSRLLQKSQFFVAQERKLITARQEYNKELQTSVRLAVEFDQRVRRTFAFAASAQQTRARSLPGSSTAGLLPAQAASTPFRTAEKRAARIDSAYARLASAAEGTTSEFIRIAQEGRSFKALPAAGQATVNYFQIAETAARGIDKQNAANARYTKAINKLATAAEGSVSGFVRFNAGVQNIAGLLSPARIAGLLPAGVGGQRALPAARIAGFLPPVGGTGAGARRFPNDGPIPLSALGQRAPSSTAAAERGITRRLPGAISGSIIGGAFPLLFGQGGGAAAGGAIGGLVGGLAGPGGSFAGSLLGTLLGDIASRGQAVQQLGEDLGFSAAQAKTLADAFKTANTDVEKFTAVIQNIRGVGLELEEQATAVQLVTALTEKYGGSFEKVGNAVTSALESGKVSQAVLNQLTSQGITVQDALAAKYDVSRDKILEMAKKGEISVQSLLDTLVELGNASTTAAEKTQTPFEKALSTTGQLFQSFWKDVQTIFAGVSSNGVDAGTALLNIFNKLLQEVLFPLGRFLARIAALFVDIVSTGVRAATELINGFRGVASAIGDALIGIVNMIPGLRTIVGLARQLFKGATGSKSNDWNDMPWPEGIPKPGSPGMIGKITAPSQLPPSGAKSASDKAARDAARLAEEIARQKAAAREALAVEKGRLMVAETADPIQQKITAAIVKQNDIQREYAAKIKESKSAEATLNFQLAERNALQANALELQSALGAETDKLTQPLVDLLQTSKERLEFENKYQEVLARGINPELAKIYTQLELSAEKQAELLTLRLAELEAAKAKLDPESAVAKALQEQIDKIKEIQRLRGQQVDQGKKDATEEERKRTEREKQLQKAKDQAELVEQQIAAIGATLGDQLMGVFDNLISKTRDWNDVLRDALMGIGKVLMMAGLNMLAGTDGKGVLSFLGFGSGFGKRAAGGPVTGSTPYVVGERGPELFVPSTGGTVVNNNDLRSAMGTAPGARNGPMLNMTFQTTNIGGTEYVSRDQLEAAMAATRKAAANDGARQGTAATLSKLQQSPSTRAKLGLR